MSREADRDPGSKQRELPGDPPQGNDREGQGKNSAIPFWEWTTALIGLVLVVGSVGFMLYQAMVGDASPPDIALRVASIRSLRNGYLVKIRAINQGGETVAGLTVEGELKGDAGSVETSEITFDYVPAHSEREGGLFFTKDPRKFALELRAKGYEQP